MSRIVPQKSQSSDGVRNFPLKGVSFRQLCVAIKDLSSPNSILVFLGSPQSDEAGITIDRCAQCVFALFIGISRRIDLSEGDLCSRISVVERDG